MFATNTNVNTAYNAPAGARYVAVHYNETVAADYAATIRRCTTENAADLALVNKQRASKAQREARDLCEDMADILLEIAAVVAACPGMANAYTARAAETAARVSRESVRAYRK